MSDTRKVAFRFGNFLVDEHERVLLHDDHTVTLTQKAFDLLVVLVRNSGHLITKDELLNQVWPDAVVAEVNLSVNISALRKVFGEDGFIETVPKRGYRFVAPVETVDSERLDIVLKQRLSAKISVVEEIVQGGLRTRLLGGIARYKQLLVLLTSILVVMVGFWFAKSRPVGAPVDSIAVLPFISNDVANNYLADGLSEATIDSLSRVVKLRVSPRANVLRYKAQSIDPQQAGQELGVGAILTGQVSQKDDLLTIQLNLIDVHRNSQTFTSQYTGKASDLISLQPESCKTFLVLSTFRSRDPSSNY